MNGDIRTRLERMRRSGEMRGSDSPLKAPRTHGQVFLFPGEETVAETAAGSCYLRELRIPLESSHGSGRLADILSCSGGELALPARDESLKDIRPAESLFLDIETTGLSGGTGTWAFLIGAGWLENDAFCLRQYFLRHPAEEKAMLSHFTEAASRFDSMVSFNGRVFDLPLIQTRQVLTGMPHRTEPRRHLDLLHCSRRLWKERLQSCSLRNLEEALLGLRRHGDIPGEEIPGVYFNYLRRGETARLREVFKHNVLDILSMVTLLVRAARAASAEEPDHPADCFSLGRLYAEAGNSGMAEKYYRRAITCGDGRLEDQARLRLALIYKRGGEWPEAVALWEEMVGRRCHDLSPYIELAKYLEHRAGDYRAALKLALEAFSRASLRRIPNSGELSSPALQHRINRLRKRLQESNNLIT